MTYRHVRGLQRPRSRGCGATPAAPPPPQAKGSAYAATRARAARPPRSRCSPSCRPAPSPCRSAYAGPARPAGRAGARVGRARRTTARDPAGAWARLGSHARDTGSGQARSAAPRSGEALGGGVCGDERGGSTPAQPSAACSLGGGQGGRDDPRRRADRIARPAPPSASSHTSCLGRRQAGLARAIASGSGEGILAQHGATRESRGGGGGRVRTAFEKYRFSRAFSPSCARGTDDGRERRRLRCVESREGGRRVRALYTVPVYVGAPAAYWRSAPARERAPHR